MHTLRVVYLFRWFNSNMRWARDKRFTRDKRFIVYWFVNLTLHFFLRNRSEINSKFTSSKSAHSLRNTSDPCLLCWRPFDGLYVA